MSKLGLEYTAIAIPVGIIIAINFPDVACALHLIYPKLAIEKKPSDFVVLSEFISIQELRNLHRKVFACVNLALVISHFFLGRRLNGICQRNYTKLKARLIRLSYRCRPDHHDVSCSDKSWNMYT